MFSSVVAAEKIIVWSASTTPEIAEEQSPYRWNYGQDPDSVPPWRRRSSAARFRARRLDGRATRR